MPTLPLAPTDSASLVRGGALRAVSCNAVRMYVGVIPSLDVVLVSWLHTMQCGRGCSAAHASAGAHDASRQLAGEEWLPRKFR